MQSDGVILTTILLASAAAASSSSANKFFLPEKKKKKKNFFLRINLFLTSPGAREKELCSAVQCALLRWFFPLCDE
jgi:hypothetical protein